MTMVKITAEGKLTTVVPMHTEIKKGTLLSIIRQSKLQREVFLK